MPSHTRAERAKKARRATSGRRATARVLPGVAGRLRRPGTKRPAATTNRLKKLAGIAKKATGAPKKRKITPPKAKRVGRAPRRRVGRAPARLGRSPKPRRRLASRKK